MTRLYAAILLILAVFLGQTRPQTVLLAAHRAGRVEVLDPITLQSRGSIKVLPLADGVTSDRRGVLFLREGIAPEFHGCCALYAVDLKTHEMIRLLEPVSGVTISPDGQHVLAQRGNVGIEVFDAHTLQREPAVPRSIAPGVYALHFSLDGRLLFGTSNFSVPTLDIFDFGERKLIRQFTMPQDLTVLGTWVGNDYYLYGHRKAAGQLWRVKADNSALEAPVEISFPDVAPECELHEQNVLGGGGRLYLYELFGGKGDRRLGCSKEIPGGVLSIDPKTGRILAHLATEGHFACLISSADGKVLYAVDVGDPNWTSVGIVRLNSATGEVLARRNLTSDVWHIDLATVPSDLVPSRQVEVTTNVVNSR